VVVSFLDTTNVMTLAATRRLGVPVLVEEHTDPSQKRLPLPWRLLRRLLYPRAAQVLVLSEEARSFFPARIQKRATVLPNPIVVDLAGTAPRPPGGRRRLIAMGRLDPAKAYDVLLDS